MKHLLDFLYWLEHGFSLDEAWNYSRDPRAAQTPAWKVYTTAALVLLAFTGAVASIFI